MNYLAHIYLSGNDEGLLLGNFIADAIKGKKYQDYRAEIARGILLHRFIDSFTDNHPLVETSKTRLREEYGKFAGIITDVFYDHFLALHWDQFSTVKLEQFVNSTYKFLNRNEETLPPNVRFMLERMIRHNWLYNYKSVEGIDRALTGLSMRTPYTNKMNLAVKDLIKYHGEFETDFLGFFPDLQNHVELFMKDH